MRRVDLIVGDVTGPVADRNRARNDTTRVFARFDSDARGMYVRVRGTSSADLEPAMDQPGEDPWSDLWFYSNPLFIDVEPDPPASKE